MSNEEREKILKLVSETGVGVMEASSVLKQFSYDFEASLKHLRGNLKIVSTQGLVGRLFAGTFSSDTFAYLLMTCNTDFVANSPSFLEFGNMILSDIASNHELCSKVTYCLDSEGGDFESSKHSELVLLSRSFAVVSQKFGETIKVKSFNAYRGADSDAKYGFYLHHTNRQLAFIGYTGFCSDPKVVALTALTRMIDDPKLLMSAQDVVENQLVSKLFGESDTVTSVNIMKV